MGDYRTQGPSPSDSTANGLLALVASAGLALLILVAFGFFWLRLPPEPRAVVQTFRESGLSVGRSYAVEGEPDWEKSLTPKVHEAGTRFLVPSMGPGNGGRVFTFRSKRDLEVMRDYYRNAAEMPFFGEALRSHLFPAYLPS